MGEDGKGSIPAVALKASDGFQFGVTPGRYHRGTDQSDTGAFESENFITRHKSTPKQTNFSFFCSNFINKNDFSNHIFGF